MYVESDPIKVPSLGPTNDPGSFMHGRQSILLSSALKKSKTINATKAVTCRRKSSRTAKATEKQVVKSQSLVNTKISKQPNENTGEHFATCKHREDTASWHRYERTNRKC